MNFFKCYLKYENGKRKGIAANGKECPNIQVWFSFESSLLIKFEKNNNKGFDTSVSHLSNWPQAEIRFFPDVKDCKKIDELLGFSLKAKPAKAPKPEPQGKTPDDKKGSE